MNCTFAPLLNHVFLHLHDDELGNPKKRSGHPMNADLFHLLHEVKSYIANN